KEVKNVGRRPIRDPTVGDPPYGVSQFMQRDTSQQRRGNAGAKIHDAIDLWRTARQQARGFQLRVPNGDRGKPVVARSGWKRIEIRIARRRAGDQIGPNGRVTLKQAGLWTTLGSTDADAILVILHCDVEDDGLRG